MSGETKKPQITRVGKKSEVTSVVEKKKSRFERRKEVKQAKAQKKRAEDAETRQAIIRKQKAQKHQTKSSSNPQSLKEPIPKTTEVELQVAKGTTLATETKRAEITKSKKAVKKSSKKAKKDKKKLKKDKTKSKKVHREKKDRISRGLPRKSKLAMIGGMAAVLLLVGYGIARDKPTGFVSSDSTTSGLLGANKPSDSSNRPDFVRVVPRTSAGDLRSHYDPDRGFFTFQEEFYSKLITVNQQPVPSDFVLSADVLLAQTEYTSVGRFESDKGIVYVARSDTGPQHAVSFLFNGLLIFITATQDITNQQWQEYIDSL